MNVGLGGIDQLLITCIIWQLLEKKWEYNNEVCQLFIDIEKAYVPMKRETLYDILIKFGVPKKCLLL